MLIIAGVDDEGRRLDRILRKAFPGLPLSGIHRFLRRGSVLVDGRRGGAADRIRAGQVIELRSASALVRAPAFAEGNGGSAPGDGAAALPDILWEGAGLLILNKPAGLAVHGPESLEDLVRLYLRDKLPPSLSFRPGPLHRLDKPASGVIVFSTSLEGARCFSALLREGGVRKSYLALAEGVLSGEARWEDLLVRDRSSRKTYAVSGTGRPDKLSAAPKEARARALPLAAAHSNGRAYTLLEVELYTGRTHQIRSQAASHGHPLAGDRKYGGSFMREGFLLHARTLEISRFPGVEGPLLVNAPLPEQFRRVLADIFGEEIPERLEGKAGGFGS
jgi:23S rRNA pseudouridine955/2504/2580 synthase